MLTDVEKQRELDDYLYTQLPEIVVDSEDEIQAAYRIALVIAFGHDELDETRLEFYTSKLKMSHAHLHDALQYFCGAGFLKIEGFQKEDHPAFMAGKEDAKELSPLFGATSDRIRKFRSDFWNRSW